MSVRLAAGLGLATAITLLGGCTYDYLQHADRVGYSNGNAVKANMQQQTINPTKGSQYVTTGLGKDGVVEPTPPGEPAAP